MPSENVYGNALLNDLHTIFPALLYEPERFENVADVLRYVGRQARYHGDTYSRLSQQHRSSVRVMREPVYAVPRGTAVPRRTRSRSPIDRRVHREELSVAFELQPDVGVVMESLLGHILRGVGTGTAAAAAGTGAFENVIVSASPEQINAVSDVKIAEELSGPCAICQEEVSEGETIRQFHRPCYHTFHQTCIDPWLRQHVRCPVCRRDIRELTVRSSTGPTEAP